MNTARNEGHAGVRALVDYGPLALFFVVLAVGGLGLTVIASWGAVRRTMRPVKALTETAEQIATTRDLTVRIGSYGNDELGRLAATFNTMLDELERSARVPFEEQVLEEDIGVEAPEDDGVGHLPGGIRPYAL